MSNRPLKLKKQSIHYFPQHNLYCAQIHNSNKHLLCLVAGDVRRAIVMSLTDVSLIITPINSIIASTSLTRGIGTFDNVEGEDVANSQRKVLRELLLIDSLPMKTINTLDMYAVDSSWVTSGPSRLCKILKDDRYILS